MVINLEKVIPVFLEKEKVERSSIWNNHIQFRQGEKIQLIAASGSGKTSLIHFLYAMRKDYSGRILLDDKRLSNCSAEDISSMRSKNISIIFQDLRLFPEHTVLKNIEIKRSLKPFDKIDQIKEMASQLGIRSKLDQQAKTCSFGEQQRIAIIRALQQPFNFLLMDEPFSHLDENNRRTAMKLIDEEVAKRNAGVILADLKKVDYFREDRLLQL